MERIEFTINETKYTKYIFCFKHVNGKRYRITKNEFNNLFETCKRQGIDVLIENY